MAPDNSMGQMSPRPQMVAQATQISMFQYCSTALRHPPGFRLHPRLQTAAWPLVVAWAMDINTDPSFSSSTMDLDMALSDSLGQDVILVSGGNIVHSNQFVSHISMTPRQQHGLRQQLRLLTSR